MANTRASTPYGLICIRTLLAMSSITLVSASLYLFIESVSWPVEARGAFLAFGTALMSFGLPSLIATIIPRNLYEFCFSNFVGYESSASFLYSFFALTLAVLVVKLPIGCQYESAISPRATSMTSEPKTDPTSFGTTQNTTAFPSLQTTPMFSCDTNLTICEPKMVKTCDDTRFYISLLVMINGVILNLSSTILECYSSSQ